MNFFRLIADFLHLLSFFIILYKLLSSKNCNGVSCKTQEIYLIVFLTRYLDLFMYFVSLYNTIMKITFISITLFIIYLMRYSKQIGGTYNREKDDDFPHAFLIPFALVMALLIHSKLDWWELLWSFSLWLESVAIFPQITILAKYNGVEKFTSHYIAALGSYRFFYLLNWIYRYKTENYYSGVSILSGSLQVLLYADFFYLYLKNLKKNFSSDLPIISLNDNKNNQ